jgi:hypothetical protein
MVIEIPKVSTSPPPHREILLIPLGNISLLIASRNTAKWVDQSWEYIHRSQILYMNVEIGNEAAKFLIWEYRNVIFGTVYSVENTEDLYTLFLTRVRAYTKLLKRSKTEKRKGPQPDKQLPQSPFPDHFS